MKLISLLALSLSLWACSQNQVAHNDEATPKAEIKTVSDNKPIIKEEAPEKPAPALKREPDAPESVCKDGKPIALTIEQTAGFKKSAFVLNADGSSDERVIFTNGDSLSIHNAGCATSILTIHYFIKDKYAAANSTHYYDATADLLSSTFTENSPIANSIEKMVLKIHDITSYGQTSYKTKFTFNEYKLYNTWVVITGVTKTSPSMADISIEMKVSK